MATLFPIQMLVYGAGDAANLDSFGPLDNDIKRQLTALSRVATNRAVAALYQLDGTTGPTVRGVLLPITHPRAAQLGSFSLGETNTGDPAELVAFCRWAQSTCPSQRTILVLSGHGLAWQDRKLQSFLSGRGVRTRGTPPAGSVRIAQRLFNRPSAQKVLKDAARFMAGNLPSGRERTDRTRAILVDGSTSDFLSNSELASACGSCVAAMSRPFDVLVCDACLMCSVEVLTQVEPYTNSVVGAIDELCSQGMNLAGAAQAITAAFRTGRPIEAVDCARAFPNTFRPSQTYDSAIAVSTALAVWNPALAYFRAFCNAVRSWLAPSDAALRQSRRNRFKSAVQMAQDLVKFANESFGDLGCFAASVLKEVEDLPSEAKAALQSARAAFAKCVLAKSVGASYARAPAVGISIFLPRTSGELANNLADYAGLAFARKTGWLGILQALLI